MPGKQRPPGGVAPGVPEPRVYVIHENPDWLPPFAAALDEVGVPWQEWRLDGDGLLDVDATPPPGVFWSRMSASSHTRGHLHAKDQTRAVLAWLEAAGRRVVNGRRVLELEMSKVDQYAALRAAGIDTPRTIAVVAGGRLREAGQRFTPPFITKHNQGGKGLGVRRFDSHEAFEAYLDSPEFEAPVDGVTLVQEYLDAAEPFLTRVEIVDGQFLYALQADTSQGFELCPADACRIDTLACPADGSQAGGLFQLRKDYLPPQLPTYLDFAHRHGIEVAGFEFFETTDGRLVTYDVNTNTNYNPDVEAQAERSGPREIARFLGRLLREQQS